MITTTLGVDGPEAQTAEQIVEKLGDRTKRGMVPWQAIGPGEDYGLQLPGHAATIARVKRADGGTEIVLQVFGQHSRQLFAARYTEPTDPADARTADPNAALVEIWRAARRTALNLDEVLGFVLEHLEGLQDEVIPGRADEANGGLIPAGTGFRTGNSISRDLHRDAHRMRAEKARDDGDEDAVTLDDDPPY